MWVGAEEDSEQERAERSEKPQIWTIAEEH